MTNKNQIKNSLIELGVSGRPHGIKGGFLFKLYNPSESILECGCKVLLRPLSKDSSIAPQGEEYIISSINFGNKTICYLENIKDRNLVEKMLPFSIHYPRDKFPQLEKNQWYLNDLVGLEVYDQDGYKKGVVESCYDNGAQVVLKLKLENEKIELPFVDQFFPHIDVDKNKIVFIRPDYD